jgi:prolyl oligopeptidase
LYFLLLLLSENLSAQNLRSYPLTKKDSISENYFGKVIKDEYRWLENTNDSTVINWVKSQSKYTEDYFSNIPYLSNIKNNIKDKTGFILDHPSSDKKYSFELFSYGKDSGKRNYENYSPILYYKTRFDSWRELIDPLKFRTYPNENIRITNYKLSASGEILAFSISRNGSDWNEILTMNMSSKKIIDTPIKWAKSSDVMWYKDGFFYQKYSKPEKGYEYIEQNKNESLFYHKIGTDPEKDKEIEVEGFSDAKLIYPNKLIIDHYIKKKFKEYRVLSVLSLNEKTIIEGPPKSFIVYPSKKRYTIDVIDFINDSAIVRTDLHANNGIIALYATNELNRFDTLIKEYNEVLTHAFYLQGKLHCVYEKDLKCNMVKFNMKGNVEKINIFPRFSNLDFERSNTGNDVYYSGTSYDKPAVLYKFNLETYRSEIVNQTEVYYEPFDCEIESIEYVSSDGIKIPLTLFYKKGLKLKQSSPILLSVYGGFGLINRPRYNYQNLLWIANGGIYAVAHVRGGGEKGKNWHFSGSGVNKQKSIDDFSSAAKFLIENNYTTALKLVSIGASNGGLMVAASALQHPELFRAVVADVGVYDMLRYQNFTVGEGFTDEYGVSSDSTECDALLGYSPLHNIRNNVQYPSMLVITGDHDDRVPPLHSYKFIAAMQNNKTNTNPAILYVNNNAGHYGSVNGINRYRESAYILSFLFNAINLQPKIIH